MGSNYYRICLIALIVELAVGQIQKSSLTFVIDDTGSMYDDIVQVKYGVNLVFDTVMNSNASQIENFILVTFNDPGTRLRTVTKDRNVFKSSLDSILVDGGGDCPELAMAGIELALTESLPGSFLYVLTDASAKDAHLLEKVQTLAMKKLSQIVFLLTGRCNDNDNDPQYQAYHKLAEATNGQVFHMTKSNIGEILKYVAETITSRKTVVTSIKFSPGYDHNMTIPVDADMKEVVIAGSGVEPKIDITAPDGSKPHAEHLVDIPRVVAVKIKDTMPGDYTAKVGSKSETSVVVTATTTIQFKHGFSTFEPSSIDDTTTKPLPDQESHLSIQLITTEDDAVLNTVVLTDLKENVIVEIPLKLINAKQKLYDTALFIPPNSLFKITVKGYDNKSKSSFSRTSATPIEPQKPFLVKSEGRAPTITIEGGITIHAEYNEPLTISCKVNGFPKPDALWLNTDGSVLPSDYSTLELPYDYINVLKIDKVRNNATYKCKAANTYGDVTEVVEVNTINKHIFNVIEAPKDITIKYKKSDKVSCKIEADPPAQITWLKNGKELLHPDKFIDISPDSSVLTIKDMRKHLEGTFKCKAKSDTHEQKFIFNVSISGFERPIIDKTEIETTSKIGEDAEVSCRIIEGTPIPKMVWYHLSQESQQFVKLDESDEVLHFPKVDKEKAGFYRCLASNKVGRDHHVIELVVEYPPTISDDKRYIRSREGIETMLPCRTNGVPKPRVAWFLNGVKIFSDRAHHIYRDNSLRFIGSTLNAGLFTCVASNSMGSTNKTIKVDYFVPVTIDPPKQSTFEVKEGDNLKLPCIANGYPQPTLNWVFFSLADNKTLPRTIRPSDVSGQLNLKHLKSTQDGYYTCVASNVESSVNITYRVKLTAPPKIGRGLTTIFTAVDGDLVMRLPCKATGSPKPEITWSKEGWNVASGSEWYSIQEDGTLVIKNIDGKSAGAYDCIAKNPLGFDKQTSYVIVNPFPDTVTTKTIYLEVGKLGEIECDVPHTVLDSIRWYKDKISIGMDASVTLNNVKTSDSGIYTCRVSNFAGSLSESIRVIVGYKPQFVAGAESLINFNDGMPAFLDCEATGKPQPRVIWFSEDEKIDYKEPIYELLMTFDERGKYTCVVSNQFGSINRTFEISSKDCILNIEDDFLKNQPLMVDEDTLKLPQYENNNGNIQIPSSNGVLLYCPRGFINIPQTKVTAVCERESDFIVDGYVYNYADLSCREEVQPTIRRTGRQCASKNTELIKIGYELLGDFIEVFEVCVNEDNNVPVYAKQEIYRSLSDVGINRPMWQDDSMPLEYDEIYQCDTQINVISSTLRKWFHAEDKCCFDKRQLVNTRNLPGGLSQKAAFNYLNIVPHWSTCNAKNWDELENRVRKLAKSSFDNLLVWTGTSGHLTLKNSVGDDENITLMDTHGQRLPVPQYLWKVIQSPETKSSVAVVQLNIPDVTATEAYKHMVCTDVCRDIEWLSGVNWRDPANGYTFCCSLPDFERAFGYKGRFGTGNNDVLKNIADWPRFSY